MQNVTSHDGRTWRVGRRRLAWQPRMPRWVRKLWWVADGLSDPITGLLALLAVLAMLPGLLWYGLNWLACLLATPLAWLGRVAFGRPVPVVAYPEDTKQTEYWGAADGIAAADELAREAIGEIRDRGLPLSLTAPAVPAASEQDPSEQPVLDRITPRLQRDSKG
ncbi:hypothetical protein [Micromonospora coxensis]|uniref:hypothetical protein n=1 Tax=Micromonospora coxensis TaxID=356852 RepID=UPI003430DFDE